MTQAAPVRSPKKLEVGVDEDDARSWPSPKQGWFWVFALVLAYICSYVDRQILSLMVDPIKADLAISDSQFSLLHGLSFAMLYCILGIPIGSMVDRHSRRNIITSGILVWSVMTAFCGLTGKFWQLFVARIGVGVGEAALSPAAYSLLADSFPRHRLGLALSVYTTGAGLGAGIAYVAGGSLYAWIESWGPLVLPVVGSVKTWQAVFFAVGLPGIPVALLIWFLTEPARHGSRSAIAPSMRDVLGFIRRRGPFMSCFLLGMSCITGATMATMAWSPAALMRAYGLDSAEAGLRLGLVTMVAFPFGLLAGAWIARQLDKRGVAHAELRVCATSAALTVPSALALAMADSVTSLLTATAVLMVFTNMSFGIAAATLQGLTPNEMRGRMTAIYLFTVNFFGMTLGPLIPALFTDQIFDGDGTRVAESIAYAVAIMASLTAVLLFGALQFMRAEDRATPSANPRSP